MAPPPPPDEIDGEELIHRFAQQLEAFSERLNRAETRASNALVDAEMRQTRERKSSQRVLYGGGGSLLGLIALLGGWAMEQFDAQAQQRRVIQAQSVQIERLDAQIAMLRSRQRAIANDALDAEAALHDGMIWLGNKLDSVSSRAKEHKLPPRLNQLGQRRLDTVFDTSID